MLPDSSCGRSSRRLADRSWVGEGNAAAAAAVGKGAAAAAEVQALTGDGVIGGSLCGVAGHAAAAMAESWPCDLDLLVDSFTDLKQDLALNPDLDHRVMIIWISSARLLLLRIQSSSSSSCTRRQPWQQLLLRLLLL